LSPEETAKLDDFDISEEVRATVALPGPPGGMGGITIMSSLNDRRH
jgi:hypothetical protein